MLARFAAHVFLAACLLAVCLWEVLTSTLSNALESCVLPPNEVSALSYMHEVKTCKPFVTEILGPLLSAASFTALAPHRLSYFLEGTLLRHRLLLAAPGLSQCLRLAPCVSGSPLLLLWLPTLPFPPATPALPRCSALPVRHSPAKLQGGAPASHPGPAVPEVPLKGALGGGQVRLSRPLLAGHPVRIVRVLGLGGGCRGEKGARSGAG